MKNRIAIGLLFVGHAVSSFAQGISMLAIPWYFASVLGQAQLFAKLVAVATFASLFWSLFAGSFIDRYPRRSVFMVINTIGFLFLCSISIWGQYLGDVPVVGVAAVFVFTFFLYNIHYPALYAFTQEMTESRDFGRVNSAIEILGQSTSVISGAIGALLISGTGHGAIDLLGLHINLPFHIEAWPMHRIFLMDGLTYALGFGLIYMIRFERIHQLATDVEPVLGRLRNGFRFLLSRPKVFFFGTLSYMVFVVLMVEVMLLLAMYVNNHLQAGADVYASSEVYYSLGALTAGLVIRKLTANMGSIRGVILLMSVCGIWMILAGYTHSVLFFYAFSVVLGLCNAGVRVLRVTWLFNQIPNNIIGRCTSIFHMFNITCRGLLLALFSLAYFSEADNVRWAYVICGAVVLLAVIPIMLQSRKLETMN